MGSPVAAIARAALGFRRIGRRCVDACRFAAGAMAKRSHGWSPNIEGRLLLRRIQRTTAQNLAPRQCGSRHGNRITPGIGCRRDILDVLMPFRRFWWVHGSRRQDVISPSIASRKSVCRPANICPILARHHIRLERGRQGARSAFVPHIAAQDELAMSIGSLIKDQRSGGRPEADATNATGKLHDLGRAFGSTISRAICCRVARCNDISTNSR